MLKFYLNSFDGVKLPEASGENNHW